MVGGEDGVYVAEDGVALVCVTRHTGHSFNPEVTLGLDLRRKHVYDNYTPPPTLTLDELVRHRTVL